MVEVNRVENNEKRSTAELLVSSLPGLCLWNKGNDPAPLGQERARDRALLVDLAVWPPCVTSVRDDLSTEGCSLT